LQRNRQSRLLLRRHLRQKHLPRRLRPQLLEHQPRPAHLQRLPRRNLPLLPRHRKKRRRSLFRWTTNWCNV
jgi:hypothetical protein